MTAYRQGACALAVVIASAMASGPATAETLTTAVTGTFNDSQENGCVFVSVYYFRVDCSYTRRWPTVSDVSIPWSGPTVSSVYYPPGSPHGLPSYTPQVGDDRTPLHMTGSITIDDQATPEVGDDRLSATFILAAAARNGQTRSRTKGAPLMRFVESWTTLTHRMGATAVSAAVPNGEGGWDYVIGTKGLPERMCATNRVDGCFPSAGAPDIAEGKWAAGYWLHAATVGPTRSSLLDQNPGATTSVDIEGYRCQPQISGDACTTASGLWGSPPNTGVTNLLLRVSTDRRRRVLTVTGFWTMEYRFSAGLPVSGDGEAENNSWYGGYISAQAISSSPAEPGAIGNR